MRDDCFEVFVDFEKITSTKSPDDSLALLLSMFSIFELAFEKNGRVLRFLYAIIYGDKRYLSNATRQLVREKSIDIYAEQNQAKKSDISLDSKTLLIFFFAQYSSSAQSISTQNNYKPSTMENSAEITIATISHE